MEANYVFAGRHAYRDSMLLAVFETRLHYGLGLAHGFSNTSRSVKVTGVDGHEVLKLDGRAAADVLPLLLGSTSADLAGKHVTLTTGKILGVVDPYGQHRLNVATYITERGGVRFAQPVSSGTMLAVMAPDPEQTTEAGQGALRRAFLRGNITQPAAVITFSCALRDRILGDCIEDEIAAVKELVPHAPLVGFQSFGEQGLTEDGVNRHGNVLISTLVLGAELSAAARVALQNEKLLREREATAAALRQSEQRYSALFDAVTDGVIVHRIANDGSPGKVVEVNGVTCKMLGRSREELLEMSPRDFDAPESALDPADVMRRLREGQIVLFEQTHVRRDGHRIPVEIHAVCFDYEGGKAVLSIVRDVSERKRVLRELERRMGDLEDADRALRASEERFRRVVQSLDDVVYTLDRDQRHTGVFGTWLERSGLAPSDFIGKTAREILGPEAADVHEPANERALAGERVVYEWHVPGPEGEVWYQTALAPLRNEAGEVTGIAGVGRDITALKSAQRQLSEYADTQEVLLREVNHRVKNNLATIVAMLHMDQDRARVEGEVACARILEGVTTRIEGLSTVHSLLSASGWRPLNLSDLCEQIIRSSLQAAPRPSAIRVDVSASPIEVSSSQAHHLTLLLHELGTNTVKHALGDRGSGAISVRVWRADGDIHLEYRDDGPGYPAQLLTGDSSQGGVGFELMDGIVRRSLAGQLSLRNDAGAVARVSFALAAEESEA
jgi:PAS domain S-box-containing protein